MKLSLTIHPAGLQNQSERITEGSITVNEETEKFRGEKQEERNRQINQKTIPSVPDKQD